MAVRKPVTWFLSPQGRRFSMALITTTGIGLSVTRFLPNTIFIDKYKEFVHYYNESKPVELSKELQERCKKCLDILKMPDVHRKLIQPFSIFGYDLFHAGSTSSKYGAIIGIPVNFTYKSFEDIEKDNIQVNHKKLNLKTDIGKKLGEALIIPEKVQEFAICREILMVQNNKVIYESAYPFMCIFFVYNLSQYINKKLNLYAAPPPIRVTLYTIVGTFGLGMYFLLKDMTETFYETQVDKKLCELGDDYVESGVIYYKKLLQRNQALRELMGNDGPKKYTAMGNENYGIRQPRLALIHRKQFFESKLKESGKGEVLENLNSEAFA
ncbi:transmembrane protein 177 [Epargyreus clarus]|uniref:transmembrane protein 177 n=1 Tax=Epargyreus clarus TaxID=520877 RepID=UPI003C309AB6